MIRPASQHAFRLCAEAEGMALLITGMLDEILETGESPEARPYLRDARASLRNAAEYLLKAGNELAQEVPSES